MTDVRFHSDAKWVTIKVEWINRCHFHENIWIVFDEFLWDAAKDNVFCFNQLPSQNVRKKNQEVAEERLSVRQQLLQFCLSQGFILFFLFICKTNACRELVFEKKSIVSYSEKCLGFQRVYFFMYRGDNTGFVQLTENPLRRRSKYSTHAFQNQHDGCVLLLVIVLFFYKKHPKADGKSFRVTPKWISVADESDQPPQNPTLWH